MEQFRRIGIYLNGEPGDDEALAFAGRFAQLAQSELVLCVYVSGLEDRSPGQRPDEAELGRQVLARLPESVRPRARVEVHADTGIREILRSARDESLDLIVVGRRPPHDQRAAGTPFARLVRKAPCNVLVIPDKARVHFSRIQVLVDGSEHSRLALRTAIEIARASGEPHPEVVTHTVFEIGYGYQYTGKTFQEAARDLEAVWREKIDHFLEEIDRRGVPLDVVYSCSRDLASAAFDLAAARNQDLIMLGSRGRSALGAVLVGDNTENVVYGAPRPVLVIKKKGETIRILDALLST
jgi:nucleotide-binding universal stress UspA family protein